MFEDKASAKAWRKENGGLLGWIKGDRVVEQDDGTWAVENKRENSTTQEFSYETEQEDGSETYIATGALIGDKDVIKPKEGALTHRDGTIYIEGGTADIGAGRYKKAAKLAKNWKLFKTKRFWNRQKKLPTKDSNGKRIKYEKVDVDRVPSASQRMNGAKRTGRRLIKGSDGKWYYSGDHYKTFHNIRFPKY